MRPRIDLNRGGGRLSFPKPPRYPRDEPLSGLELGEDLFGGSVKRETRKIAMDHRVPLLSKTEEGTDCRLELRILGDRALCPIREIRTKQPEEGVRILRVPRKQRMVAPAQCLSLHELLEKRKRRWDSFEYARAKLSLEEASRRKDNRLGPLRAHRHLERGLLLLLQDQADRLELFMKAAN